MSAPGDIRIGGALDRRRAEALALELRALARQFGLAVSDLQIVPADGAWEGGGGSGTPAGADPDAAA